MICVPIRQKRIDTILKKIKESEKDADLTEIWFDEINGLNEKNLQKIFSKKKRPVIYKSLGNQKKINQVIYSSISEKNENFLINLINNFFSEKK